MIRHFFIIVATIFVTNLATTRCQGMGRNKLTKYYSWRFADYAFPDDAPAEFFIRSEEYIPQNIIILDASVSEQNGVLKTFVTTPRMRKGTPASLSVVSPKSRNNQYLLQPYPDWSWHRQNVDSASENWAWTGIDCKKMISVFRTTVDSACGRLWVVDTGFLHAINKQVCPPKILIFDLVSDKIIATHVLKDVTSKTSLLITIEVDVRNNKCDDAFAYIADVVDYKLIVFDLKRKSSWNIESNLFYPYPLNGVFNINGVEFDLMDGLFGLALGPVENNDRKLYFHSLASVRESWVDTSVLRNQSLFLDGENKVPRSFNVFNQTRRSQSAAQDMSDGGVLFFGLLSENSVACWNSKLQYRQQNIETVAQDSVELEFSSGLKVTNEKVWVTTSRFPKFFTGVMNFTDVNFRILGASVEDLVRGTTCSIKSTSPNYSTFRPPFQESSSHKIVHPSYSNRGYTKQ